MQHVALLHQALWSPYLTEVLEHFCNRQELHRIFGWYNPKELSLQKIIDHPYCICLLCFQEKKRK